MAIYGSRSTFGKANYSRFKKPMYKKKKKKAKGPFKVRVSKANKADQGFVNTFVPLVYKPKFYGKLRYGQTAINLAGGTSQVGYYTFTANGLFDPSISGGSLQPAGFVQIMGIYEHYRVVYATAKMTITNNSTTPVMVGLVVSDAPALTSVDPANNLEGPYANWVNLEPATAYGATKTLCTRLSMAKYFGVKNVDDNVYRGDVLSNPVEQVYFMIKSFAIKGGATDIFINAVIEYSAIFTEPREMVPS